MGLRRSDFIRPLNIFKKIIPESIWKIIVERTNSNLAQRRNQIRKKDLYLIKPTNCLEMMQVYGIKILLENTFANDTKNLRIHWNKLKKEYQLPLSWSRFEILYHSISPTIDDLEIIQNELKNSFQR